MNVFLIFMLFVRPCRKRAMPNHKANDGQGVCPDYKPLPGGPQTAAAGDEEDRIRDVPASTKITTDRPTTVPRR